MLHVVGAKVTGVWSKCRTESKLHNKRHKLAGLSVSLIFANQPAPPPGNDLDLLKRARERKNMER